jgi:multiple sugar transport system substrate-binding protein
VWSNGGEIVTYPENEVEIDMEETIEAWQFLADLPNKYGVQPTPDQAGEGASALFESGRTAMTVTSASYSLRAITVANEKPEFDWDLAPIPSKDGKPVFTRSPNSSIAVYSGTKYAQEAYNFTAFMSSEKAMEGITRAVPSRKAVATGSYLSRTETQNWQVQVDALLNHHKIEPRTPYFEELDRAIDDAWHLVLDGVQPADETMIELKPQLEAILRGEG